MPFINYFLTSIISFSGLIIGIIISVMADEEIKPGKNYFIYLQKLILILILFFILYFYNLNLYLVVFASLIFAAVIHFYNIPSKIVYPFLAVVFAISYGIEKLFLIESSLIFLYGLPTASLLIDFKKKNYTKIILGHISFVVISLALFLITL